MRSLDLSFYTDCSNSIQLSETSFLHPLVGGTKRAVRARSALETGTFAWSSGVMALSVLCLRYAAFPSSGDVPAFLRGGRGSVASKLDSALAKRPNWVFEVFGTDSYGNAMTQRVFNRLNPELKRPGPVVITFNKNVLAPHDLSIFVNDQRVSERDALCEYADRLQKDIDGQSLMIPPFAMTKVEERSNI